MNIRPHHLLCIRTFRGEGYSSDFTENMQKTIDILTKNNPINIKKGLDEICSCCPNKTNNTCKSETKVQDLDNNVLKYFEIEEKEYNYKELELMISIKITEEIFNNICKMCEWKQNGVCTYAEMKNKSLKQKRL